MTHKALAAFLALIPFGAPAVALADPAYGSTFVQLRSSVLQSPAYTDNTGQVFNSPCVFDKDETALYVEQPLDHGADAATLNVPYDRLACGAASAAGLGEVELGFQHSLRHTATSRLSLDAIAVVPGGGASADPAITYGAAGAELGARETLTFHAFSHYGWLDATVGARGYSGAPATRLRGAATLGYPISPSITLLERFDFTQSLGAANLNVSSNPTISLRYNDQEAESGLLLHLHKGVSVYVSELSVLGGRNYGLGKTFNVGLWSR
ncbi:MAG: hypothetical protein ABSB70_17505 [Candidatus Velthaea sp.]|jgi:hypothetical protein